MFAVEDGHGGILCTDGAVVIARMVERLGKTVRLWPTQAEAERGGRAVFDKSQVIEVDEMGRAQPASAFRR